MNDSTEVQTDAASVEQAETLRPFLERRYQYGFTCHECETDVWESDEADYIFNIEALDLDSCSDNRDAALESLVKYEVKEWKVIDGETLLCPDCQE